MQKIPGVSLYHQIKQDLRVKIEPLDPGTKIETEQQLSDHYGVSRGTIRQAINDLASEGLLQKVQGSGTFRSNNSGIHICSLGIIIKLRSSCRRPVRCPGSPISGWRRCR